MVEGELMEDFQDVLTLQNKVLELQEEVFLLRSIAKHGGFVAGKIKGRKLEKERIIKLLEGKTVKSVEAAINIIKVGH